MTRDSAPAADWLLLDDALFEAGEPQLASRAGGELPRSGLSCEEALVLKLFGAEQPAPRDLTDAFDRMFGNA
jgi:hypothetical protein